ncbi:DUF397 domain-containing protein [Streptomyces atroolivaceus]|uniref:DUF397 domain-containing protein n=1 Tax=Streptomyces atroolivaceus TaxID=66869 RepID=UPI00202564FE|nr:DUF397 domain-containing protein [Streptomyces atroolivaceus]
MKSNVDGATGLAWKKSSYSSGEGGQCVEVAAADTAVHIRDSKQSGGPTLRVGAVQWTTFVRMAARG